MKTYRHENGEDVVEVDEETYRTFTSGTQEPLYEGTNEEDARKSLEWDDETWNRVLMRRCRRRYVTAHRPPPAGLHRTKGDAR